MRTWKQWCLFALALCSCNAPVAPIGTARERVTEELPKPVQYSEWGDTSVWPQETQRAALVIGQAPGDPTRFRAYGVDADKDEVVFTIEGSFEQEYPKFATQMAIESMGRLPCRIGLAPIPMELPPPPPPPIGTGYTVYSPRQEILSRANRALEGNCP